MPSPIVVRILQIAVAAAVAWTLATAALDAVEEATRCAQAEVEAAGQDAGTAVIGRSTAYRGEPGAPRS